MLIFGKPPRACVQRAISSYRREIGASDGIGDGKRVHGSGVGSVSFTNLLS